MIYFEILNNNCINKYFIKILILIDHLKFSDFSIFGRTSDGRREHRLILFCLVALRQYIPE